MGFFIKKNSTLPYLEVELEDISKKYDISPEQWENCAVTFSMYDNTRGIFRIANKTAKLVVKERSVDLGDKYNYFLRYEFSARDTKATGDFTGEFKVDFTGIHECGKLTVPNTKPISITIQPSITKTNFANEVGNTKTILSPWYFGTYSVIGGLVEIPTSEDINIKFGTIDLEQNPSHNILVPFNSTDVDFLWFAVPQSSGLKTSWEIDIINRGEIGGEKIMSGNLFPDPDVISFNGIRYYLYISNYRTEISTITIKF